jgi:threonine dehydrogenase-like Zn-dependent dehydrogenase
VQQIKPAFCGICGTDLHEFLGGANLIPKDTPHPITGETLPLALGHEFSGTIEEVGEGVQDLKAGDRICVQPTIYDNECLSCKRGLVNCCDKNGFVGLSGWGGGMSEHVVVPQDSVKKLPDNVSLEVGALVEPLAVGWHAVSISPYKPGDRVLVLGGGPIGLAVVQALKARACDTIIVSEISPRRKQYAKEFGAHHVIDPSKEDVVKEVQRLTNGEGADIGFDAAGAQIGVDTAMRAIKARGMLVNIAVWEKRATLNMNDLVFRERAYMGVACYALGDFEQVIDAISTGKKLVPWPNTLLRSVGKLTPEPMITRKIKMDEVEDKGFNALINDKDNHVKILVDIGASVS